MRKALVDLAVEKFGGLDIAFNNVGAVGQMGTGFPNLPLRGLARDAATPT